MRFHFLVLKKLLNLHHGFLKRGHLLAMVAHIFNSSLRETSRDNYFPPRCQCVTFHCLFWIFVYSPLENTSVFNSIRYSARKSIVSTDCDLISKPNDFY